MIKKVQNVKTVRLNVFGESMIKGVVAPLKLGVQHSVDLPHNFEFNGDWTVSHSCTKCKENIQFGSSDDGLGGFVVHRKLKTLFSRYYTKAFLENISSVLQGTKVIQPATTDWVFVTNESFNDENATILSIPKKTILNYRCSSCGSEYICLYSIGVGAHPERNLPEGRHGKMFIHEIVHVQSDDGTSFLDLVSENQN